MGVQAGSEKKETSTILLELYDLKGYTRVVGKTEYAFNKQLVEKQTIREAVTEESVKSFMNNENALWYLGNKLGVTNPYSYETLLYELEGENQLREAKKKEGEVIYGVETFEPTTYYEYRTSNLKLEIIRHLSNNADEDLLSKAKVYYEERKENYEQSRLIRYTDTEGGVTTQKEITRQQFKTLESVNDGLMRFFVDAKKGDVYCYNNPKLGECEVVVTEVEYDENTFSAKKEKILFDYLEKEELPKLLSTIAKQNPLEFQ